MADVQNESFIPKAESDEQFSWSAVILPFLFPALAGLLYGYDIGATSGADVSLKSAKLSGTTWYNISAVANGLVVSGSIFGALIGSIIAFNFADLLGRRRELLLSSLLYTAGALLMSSAPYLFVLIIGRLIYGLAIGLAMHAAPLYIAETAPYQIRGMLVSLKELFIVLGMLLGYLMSSMMIDVYSGWRYMYGGSIPLALILGLGMWWMPPSPRWILLQVVQHKANAEELKKKAASILCRLRGRKFGDLAADEQIDENLRSIQEVYEQEGLNDSIWVVFQGACLRALTIGGGVVFFQQITGQPSVLYYAASILQSAGFSAASDATRVSTLIGLFKVIMTGIAVATVDKVGRRPLLVVGVSGMLVSLFLLSAYYAFLGSVPAVAVVALLLYVGCYQVSFGPIGWLLISEIFPLRTRARALSVAVLINFATNALVTFAFSPLQALIGAAAVFLIFGIITILALLFIIILVPETKGLTLEEIECRILK